MSANRALIIDRSQEFRDLARRVLKAIKIHVDCVDSSKAGLRALADREPSIIVLAVEQPKKRGFEVFTQIKNMTRKIPIVISTSSVPMEDMLLHQKLRLHADAYLDKRGLGEAQLIRMLNGLLGLKMDPFEVNAATDEAQRMKRREDSAAESPRDAQADGQDIAATLAALEELDPGGEDEPEEQTEAAAAPAVDDGETVRLRRQVESLQAEIETARRAAGSSPFSDEYMKLSEKATDSDRQLARLRSEIERLREENRQRVEKAGASERKLTAAAKKLVEQERARGEAAERADELEGRLRASEEELKEAGARIEHLEARLAAMEDDHERTVKAMRDEYAAAVATMREGLDKSHQYALKQARAEHEQTRNDELAELRAKLDEEMARAREAHKQELGRLRLGHEQALVRLRGEHDRAIEEKDRQMEAAARQAAEVASQAARDRKREAETAERDRVAQLECAESKRRSDIAELAARHRSDLGKAVGKVRAELIGELETLRSTKQEADELAHEQAVKAAEAYDALLREKQETQKLRAQLVEEIARLREQHARELKLMEQEQARALESLAGRLDQVPRQPPTDPKMLSELLESVQTLDNAEESSAD